MREAMLVATLWMMGCGPDAADRRMTSGVSKVEALADGIDVVRLTTQQTLDGVPAAVRGHVTFAVMVGEATLSASAADADASGRTEVLVTSTVPGEVVVTSRLDVDGVFTDSVLTFR